MILFNIGHDALDLFDSFFCDIRFATPFLSLQKEVFDKHGCLKEDNTYLNGGNLSHIFDVRCQKSEVALEDQVPVGELKLAQEHNFGDLFNIFEDWELEEKFFLVVLLFFPFLNAVRAVLSYLN